MRTIALLITLLALFAYWDLAVRLIVLVGPGSAGDRLDRLVRQVSRMIFALAHMFVRLSIEKERSPGTALPERFLLVANHQSLIDIPVLIRAFEARRLRFVGKRELFRGILLVSPVFRALRHGCIDRHADFGDAIGELRRLATRSRREGTSLAVFPEGTRSRDGSVGPFYSGAVKALLRVEPLPVVAVAMDGGYRASRLHELFTSLEGLAYRVKILAVYEAPGGKAEIQRVLDDSRARIEAQVERWRSIDAAPGRPIARPLAT